MLKGLTNAAKRSESVWVQSLSLQWRPARNCNKVCCLHNIGDVVVWVHLYLNKCTNTLSLFHGRICLKLILNTKLRQIPSDFSNPWGVKKQTNKQKSTPLHAQSCKCLFSMFTKFFFKNERAFNFQTQSTVFKRYHSFLWTAWAAILLSQHKWLLFC